MIEELKIKLTTTGKIIFKVKIIAKSPKNEITGTLGEDILKIRIKAPATDNKANIALIKFLGDIFNTPTQNICIISGSTSPLKLIQITKN